MANLNNSINTQIFAALKVAEKVREVCPMMLIGNPGTGKTKTVELFAEVRGYELVLLRGNSESHESILGYPIAPTDTSVDRSTIRLRPEWFQKILDNSKNGKKSLLFLDEITTALDQVQAAMLHLVFERMVGLEKLPSDTLIVAAGNYASNLSNSMNMLPPLMNRFCIFNIIPKISDLEFFLNKYEGSLSGNRKNNIERLKTTLREIDSQELTLSETALNKIGEYVERQVLLVTKQLAQSGEKVLDLSVTELSNLYSDLDKDEKLLGFITLRSLNYLRDITVASYVCFGKSGILSDNYRNMVDGLVGLSLSRAQDGEVRKAKVTSEYVTAMAEVISDIEKMNNNRLPEYEEFFNRVISSEDTVFDAPTLNALDNKIKELMGDTELSEIERPLDVSVAEKLGKSLVKSVQKIINYKINEKKGDLESSCPVSVETLSNDVVYWNLIATLFTRCSAIINDRTRNYDKTIRNEYSKVFNSKLRKAQFKLRTIKTYLKKTSPALVETIPEIKSISEDED